MNISLLYRGAILIGGQVGAQLISMVVIFVCVRFLPKSEFGMYVAASAVQAVLSIALDLQTSTALTTFGSRKDFELEKIVFACKYIRKKNYIYIVPGSILGLYFLFYRQFDISATEILLIWLIIIFTSFCQQNVAINLQVLAVVKKSDMIAMYQLYSAVLRFILVSLALWLKPTVESVLIASAVSVYIGSLLLEKNTVFLCKKIILIDMIVVDAIKKFIRPMILPTLVFAVQGNLWTMLISGSSSATILAEVGALNRFAQIFPLISTVNNPVLLPVLARAHRQGSFNRAACYFFGGAIFITCAVLLGIYFFDRLLLRLLGVHYEGLAYEFFIVMAAAAVNYLSGFIYMLLLGRSDTQFQYLSVPITIAIQVGWFLFFGINTSRDATEFIFITGVGVLFFQGCLLFRSLVKKN